MTKTKNNQKVYLGIACAVLVLGYFVFTVRTTVLLTDGFESGYINWLTGYYLNGVSTNDAGFIAVSSLAARTGNYGLLMRTNPLANASVLIMKDLPSAGNRRYGISAWIKPTVIPSHAADIVPQLDITVANGYVAYPLIGWLYYCHYFGSDEGVWIVGSGRYPPIIDVFPYSDLHLVTVQPMRSWTYVKLVVDLPAPNNITLLPTDPTDVPKIGRYVSLTINSTVYDLSSFGLQLNLTSQIALLGADRFSIFLRNINSDQVEEWNIDDVTITTNER